MTEGWPALRADIAFRHHLLYPQGSGLRGWLRASLLSRGTLVLAVHRLTWAAKEAKANGRAVGRPLGWLAAIGRRMAMIVAKAYLANSMQIAPGVWLPDGGHIVLGAVEIGPETIIHPRVTIGMGVVEGGRPRVGARVWIGSDSVVYGAIAIGDGATILPGTVVTRHVPPGAVVSGNPPRLIATRFDNTEMRATLALQARTTRECVPPLAEDTGPQ
jgi:serine acetyltransferase